MQCVFSRRLHGETQAPWNLSQYTERQVHHPKNVQHDPQPAKKPLKSPEFLDLPSNFSKIQFLLTNFSLHSDSTQTFAALAFVYPCFLQRNLETRNKELI